MRNDVLSSSRYTSVNLYGVCITSIENNMGKHTHMQISDAANNKFTYYVHVQ